MSINNDTALLSFLDSAHTPYHAVSEMKRILREAGFTELFEKDSWQLEDGKGYMVSRYSSSLIAFVYHKDVSGFAIGAAHTDSPTYRVKGELASGGCMKLDVEKYGGAIEYSWFDRPLTVAGRAFVRVDGGIEEHNVYIDKDLCVIPSVAPHMSRQDSFTPNVAVDLSPVISLGTNKTLLDLVAEAIGTSADKIVSHDLFLAQREKGCTFGANGEFILSRKIDDLASAYALLTGLVRTASNDGRTVAVFAAHDHEEVGSMSTGGAWSTFLRDTLTRIAGDRYLECLAQSMIVSADNGHAVHPNHPEYSDRFSSPTLGNGILIKNNSSRRYATDALSEAYFRTVCERVGAPVQTYFHRADRPCGSTLGTLTLTEVSVPTVDIGLPQLAMHSAFEMIAKVDLDAMITALSAFYGTEVVLTEKGYAL